MFATDIVQQAVLTVVSTLSTPSGLVALGSAGVASALILAGTFVKTMIPLRWLAVGSNLGFMVYGALFPSLPMLVLHALLLPINLYRVFEMARLSRRVNAAAAHETSDVWLRPYMRRRRLAAGQVLFRKGDLADHLYLLTEGRIELVEFGSELGPGRIFGEIAFFAPDRRRTVTARCLEPCQLLSIDESTVRQLYFQNPEFGFHLIALVAGRLSADVHRLEGRLIEASAQLADEGSAGADGAVDGGAPAVAAAHGAAHAPAAPGDPDEPAGPGGDGRDADPSPPPHQQPPASPAAPLRP